MDAREATSRLRLTALQVAAPLLLLAVIPACTDRGAGRRLNFEDRTAKAGITFEHVCGGSEKDYILEVNGGGVALFDHDGDGDLDIFFVNGSRFDQPAAGAPNDALYRNDGGWKFVEVTRAAGLAESAWGCGAAVADVDNDGDLDLYVTNYGPDELWLNDGDGTFTASGASSGASDPGWGASATFFDYDRDGWVDLFVVRYLVFDRSLVNPRGKNACQYKGQEILCGPVGLPKEHGRLYRNLGGGKFRDVSEEAGLLAVGAGYGLGVVAGDYDGDGWPDLYVAADTTPNLLLRNRGDGTFEDAGMAAGAALNDAAVAQAGMGVDFGFVRNAVHEDLFVVNYEDDSNTYYRNDGDGFFTEITSTIGLATPSFPYLGWGAFFADLDLDADLDIFVANGHVVPQADAVPSSPGYRQRNMVFLNDGSGRFTDASATCGPGLGVKKSSRGAAAGDLDGDGDLDIAVNDIDDRATVLECAGRPLGHWLAVRAAGTRSNRAAIGAVVRLMAGGRWQARRIRASSSYASVCELDARFGLGGLSAVEKLLVEWPAGGVESFPVSGVDRLVSVVEGQGTAAERTEWE
jgi:hypothetical protein